MQRFKQFNESRKPRWKKAGPNGEIETTIDGNRWKVEKATYSSGEYQALMYNKRNREWEWVFTQSNKKSVKDAIEDNPNRD